MTKKEQAYHDLGKFYINFSIIFFFVGKVNCISMKKNDADSDKYLATAFHSTISKDFKKIILTQIECRGIDTTDFISLCDEDLAFLVSARTDLAH